MPELPEVETVRAELAAMFRDRPEIKGARLMRPDIRFAVPPDLPSRLKGQRVQAVRRRAKYLLLETPAVWLLSHLGMTGSWRLVEPGPTDKHDHFFLDLSDGRSLAFRDPRRFGVLDLVEPGAETTHPRLRGLGPEPLDEAAFHADYLRVLARGRTSTAKAFLMDQRIVVGVGNIYASEALHRAGVRPQRRTGAVTRAEWEKIAASVRDVLREAIESGGSSVRDYRSASGAEGDFQNAHRVYGRDGEPCVACQTVLRAKVIAGRSSFYCPKCQR